MTRNVLQLNSEVIVLGPKHIGNTFSTDVALLGCTKQVPSATVWKQTKKTYQDLSLDTDINHVASITFHTFYPKVMQKDQSISLFLLG